MRGEDFYEATEEISATNIHRLAAYPGAPKG